MQQNKNEIKFIGDEDNFLRGFYRDRRLSLKLKGLLGLVKALPRSWEFSLRGLAKISKESKNTLNAYTQELVSLGYCKITPVRDEGKFSGYLWTFYEVAQEVKPTESQKAGHGNTESKKTVSQKTVSQNLGHNIKEVLKDGLKKGEGVLKPANNVGENLLPLPVLIWIRKTGLNIPEAGISVISKRVKNMEVWADVLDLWLASSWTANNIAGQVDRYEKQISSGDYPEQAEPKKQDPEKEKEKEELRRLMYGE